MVKRLVLVDTGVLIAAARGSNEAAQRAMQILDDPDSSFASSVFVQLEVLPKPVYHKKRDEVAFYDSPEKTPLQSAGPRQPARRETCHAVPPVLQSFYKGFTGTPKAHTES